MASVRTYIDFLEFVWDVRNGTLSLSDLEDGRAFVATGYSGKGIYKDDPSFESRVAEGPIPRGMWLMGAAYKHPKLGPVSIPLSPIEGNSAFDRSGFFIHGDSLSKPGTASTGCIILDRRTREWVVKSGVRRLAVV